MTAPPTVPVTILTGFLGSGKTTLLKHLLADPAARDTAVLINELGEIALDHELVKSVREDLVVLASGCVCCSVRNDLMRALCELHVKAERGEIPRFARVVVETTGLADPTPIVGTIARNGLLRSCFHLAAVVTTVDATLGDRTLSAQPEAVKQVAMADRILVTKTDLAGAEVSSRLEQRLAAVNPLAPRFRARRGVVHAEALLAEAPAHPIVVDGDPAAHEHEPHGRDVFSFSELVEGPLDYRALALWLSMMTQVHGEHLLRVKGILHVDDDPLPVVVQSVQHVVYPVTSLPRWPFEPRASKIVGITRGLERAMVDAIRESLRRLVKRASPLTGLTGLG
ncbi:MAG: GTP-binding protein [Labilithrix sp.]|nr:GTP-binding protein [Labilithrix sp.]MCW5817443.1 GTP-binding protein [Labilithrix sp.]